MIIIQMKNKSEGSTKERNQQLASILVLLISFSEKIQNLKEKICGFGFTEFSPQIIFEALDLTQKGYLDLYDIRTFLQNDNIRDTDILLLINKFGDKPNTTKLTYLSYLNFLKPYFNQQLARDLLLRDSMSMNKKKSYAQQQSQQIQQMVLLLINQLFLLNCICISEVQEAKNHLFREYMLNGMEICQIIGVGNRMGVLKTIYQFIDCYSSYQLQQSQVKFLLAYTQSNQQQLGYQQNIAQLFLPSKSIKVVQSTQRDTQRSTRQKEKLKTNYNKTYLGPKDLINQTHKVNFLNYIHPNSQQYRPQNVQYNNIQHQRQEVVPYQQQKQPIKPQRNQYPNQSNVNPSQQYNSKDRQSNLYPKDKPKQPNPNPSGNIPNHSSHSYNQSSYYQPGPKQSPNTSMQTPLLQQFMKDSNIRRNMGADSKGPHRKQLGTLVQQSALSNMEQSDAFDRGDLSNYDNSSFLKSRHYQQSREGQRRVEQGGIVINRSNIQVKERMDGSGVLGQFIKPGYR